MVSHDFYITFDHFCSCKIHQVPNVTPAMSDISSACRPDFHIYLGDCRFTFCSRLLACARVHASGDVRFFEARLSGHVLHQEVGRQVEKLFCPFLQEIKHTHTHLESGKRAAVNSFVL